MCGRTGCPLVVLINISPTACLRKFIAPLSAQVAGFRSLLLEIGFKVARSDILPG